MLEFLLNLLKSVGYGIVQGITEWLPISSTGHLILMNTFMPLNVFSTAESNQAFWDMYKVVIQFGSIIAVILLFFKKLNPFNPKLKQEKRTEILKLWLLVILASVPAGVLGILFEDIVDNALSAPWVIGVALIVYGILFLWMENGHREYTVMSTNEITPIKAIGVGAFQALALIPGTSRSGSTILGSTLLGFDRKTAAEFSFFLAIPVMLGASGLKIVKYIFKGAEVSFSSFLVLLVGFVISFLVSIVVIRKLMAYIRTHDFKIFGIYRIILGIAIIAFTIFGVLS